MFARGAVECRLHADHRQTDLFRRLFPEKCIEFAHARLLTVLLTEPIRSLPLQVADYDALAVPFGRRDFLDPNDPRARLAGALE